MRTATQTAAATGGTAGTSRDRARASRTAATASANQDTPSRATAQAGAASPDTRYRQPRAIMATATPPRHTGHHGPSGRE